MHLSQSLRPPPLPLPQCVCDLEKGWLTIRLGPDTGKCACEAEGFTLNVTTGRCIRDPPPCAPGQPCPCGTSDKVLVNGTCECDQANGWWMSRLAGGVCVCSKTSGFIHVGDKCLPDPAYPCVHAKGLHCDMDDDGNLCSPADPRRCAACALTFRGGGVKGPRAPRCTSTAARLPAHLPPVTPLLCRPT